MRTLRFLAYFFLPSVAALAQPKKTTLERPTLVVGIVVDQMRADYLYRYYDKYTENGFKRLMREGFNCRNNHYHYAATYTGPGHAHIYSGSAPALSGITANDWYDRQMGRMVYCTEDTAATAVGNTSPAGKMSPRNLLVTTVTDQLKLATQGRSKVIGVALKDRGAILPAGHAANAAYWFDSKDGNWISSSYYLKDLPQWAKEFNGRRLPDQYNTQKWETLLPIDQYVESTADDNGFEGLLAGETKPVFPHGFAATMGLKYEELRTSPFGDLLTKEMALAAMKGENLGKGGQTDFLCVSFSSPDYIGHRFGTASIEVEDEYLRLDRVIADMLNAFDAQVGKGNYLVFLSADHGAADNPAYSQSMGIPAGSMEYAEINSVAKAALEQAFGPGDWIKRYFAQQFYLNLDLLREKKHTVSEAFQVIRLALLKKPGVLNVVNFHDLNAVPVPEQVLNLFRNVHHPNRSGDVYVVYEPGWLEGYRKGGTTHGTLFNYDTHVPLLFYGWGIKPGETVRRTHIADIAPTVSMLLRILQPNGTVGEPIGEVLK